MKRQKQNRPFGNLRKSSNKLLMNEMNSENKQTSVERINKQRVDRDNNKPAP